MSERSTSTPDDLLEAVACVVQPHLGDTRRVTGIERRPSAYQSSFRLEELEVSVDSGLTLSIVFKDLSSNGLFGDARRARPYFLHNPLREIDTYRTILAPRRLGTATCYGAVVEPRRSRYWLFLEKVAGVELYQVGDFSVWEAAAGWLGRMHRQLAHDSRRLGREAHLLNYDAGFYRLWLQRAKAFMRDADRDARSAIDWLAERHESVVDYLTTLPVTVLHGDFYDSNVLVEATASDLRICPVDWEMAAVGPGLLDLAALTTGEWSEQERQHLALAYQAALSPESAYLQERHAFLAALDYCRLQLSVQWLGWSWDWSPPAAHRRDWLGEAVALAERLRL